ncbi:MAG: hypothetical protein K8963_08910, partial [Proteobacteria bacterium]|nr:hypothetical protein [Pseudomonadota bacterium]
PITACDFIDDTMMPVSALDGLSIIVTDDRGACSITGTLTGTGPQTFTVRATSTIGTDEATITFTVTQKPLTRVSQISNGLSHTCAVSASSELYCWGAGADGRLGLDDTTDRDTPIRVGVDIDWAQVSAGDVHTCAVDVGGKLYCWGESNSGRLGLGTTTDQDTPTRVGDATNWAQVSVGSSHSCATTTDNKLFCWGDGGGGRLGLGNTVASDTPARVGDATDWVQVSVGISHTCAVKNSGDLLCWGNGDVGQLGLGDNSGRTTPTAVGTDDGWVHVSAGNVHTCAVNTSGELYCWGFGLGNRLGLASTANRNTPTRVGVATDWTQVSATIEHTCSVNTNGELYCWGTSIDGGLGLGGTTVRNTPTRVSAATNWSQINTGADGNTSTSHTCATTDTGRLHCWGTGANGRLGLGDSDNRNRPAVVSNTPALASTVPNLANLDLTDTAADAAGFNDGMLEIGKIIPPIVFVNSGGNVQADGCATASNLPAGLRVHPAVNAGTVTCQITGIPTATTAMSTYNLTATNGIGADTTPATVTFQIVATAPFFLVNPTDSFFEVETAIDPIIFSNTGLDVQASGCAVDPTLPLGLTLAVYADDGTMTCRITGTPSAVTARQVYTLTATSTGGGTATAMVSIDIRLKVLKSATQVDVGGNHTCAISGDGELFCWGTGGVGLGAGLNNDRTTPHIVGDATNWSQVSVAANHACAINTDDELYCWGVNPNGQLGLGDTDVRNVPTRVGMATNWSQVSAGAVHTCAINSVGHLLCWGESDNGRLGTGDDAMDSLTPARVGDATNWSQVSAGATHTCAINSAGQLYCWGEGDTGRLGLGTSTNDRNAPIRVGAPTIWMQVSVGPDSFAAHTCAINSAGQLYCWGSNILSKLGLGDSNDRDTPTQVGEASNWAQIGRGFFNNCATRSDGQLYCWGSGGSNGRLGLGELNIVNAPSRVGDATNWSQISTGENHTCAINSDNRLYCWGRGLSGVLGLGDTTNRTTPVAVTPAP